MAFPIPLLAPVTRATFPLSPRSMFAPLYVLTWFTLSLGNGAPVILRRAEIPLLYTLDNPRPVIQRFLMASASWRSRPCRRPKRYRLELGGGCRFGSAHLRQRRGTMPGYQGTLTRISRQPPLVDHCFNRTTTRWRFESAQGACSMARATRVAWVAILKRE